ncbi:MAG: hypothetical protein NTY20_05545 [Candidatus Aenigmarchaeota archaeon]|nr:hypothetical protein [Candidatus Aenigmarchaeota archaeon]
MDDTLDNGFMDAQIPIHVRGNIIERSHLKYTYDNNWTKFYGFHIEGNNVVVALQESSWYIALIKPFYNRIMGFQDFKTDNDDIDFSDGKISFEELCNNAVKKSNSEEKLARFFASKPTIRKLEKSMQRQILELNDSDYNITSKYIDRFKKYYTPNPSSAGSTPARS